MNYPDDLDYILKEHVKILVDWINNERGPFSEAYVNIWYKRYVEPVSYTHLDVYKRQL